MRSPTIKVFSCAFFSIISFIAVTPAVPAAQLHLGWDYAIDSPNDSLGVDPTGNIQPGGSIYEIFGMAVKDDVATDSVWFALSSNLPLYGENLTNPYLDAEGKRYSVPDSNIGWGDLFLDFSGQGSLKAASDANQLFGIKFAINNDSEVPTLGVYSNASITSVTTANAGYSNLWNNNNVLQTRTGQTRSANMGDLAWNASYFAPYTTPGSYDNLSSLMPNVLASGAKIGEVTLLNRENLVKAGLDPEFFSPTNAEVFGFRIPKALLPAGDFIATLLAECINDGIALSSKLVLPAPPPPADYICPVTEGQQNALLPDRVVEGVKIFDQAPSGAWFDPPANMGFQFVALDGSLFTSISGFPCAVAPASSDIKTAPFNVLVKNEQGNYEIIGQYFPGQSVDFTKILGKGVSEFVISGIDPDAWEPYFPNTPPLAFPITFDRDNAKFAFNKIPDTTKLPIAPIVIPPEPPSDGGPLPPEPPTIIPGISDLPSLIGPDLQSPCLSGGSCNNSAAVPEPSTIAGIAFAAIGLLKFRRYRQKK
jgi:hypothetical protein